MKLHRHTSWPGSSRPCVFFITAGFFALTLLVSVQTPIRAQDILPSETDPSVVSDSLGNVSSLPDSIRLGAALDSLKSNAVPDPLKSKKKKKSGVEGPVDYKAKSIEFFVKEKKTFLDGKAEVDYQDIALKAEKIPIDWNAKEMRAEGVWDSVWVKTEEGDSTRRPELRGGPEFKEGGDVMTGEVMLFNFETKKGRVLRGRTAYEDGFYGGEALKMVKPRVLNVGDASFTTCDEKDAPHFHIYSKQMKIMVNDKVIARPVVLHIGKIPVVPLPFAVFPIKKGRHSGLLIPRYGESSSEGRYLRGIGYYWAPSDYWDIRNEMDFFEKSGFLFRSKVNYQVRYKLRGTISGSWTRKDFEASGTKQRRWDLNINHSQEITPNTKLTIDAKLVSSSTFYEELSTNREYRLTQELRSNAKLSQKWGRSGSIQVYLNQTRDLKTDDVSLTLPQITATNRITSLIPAAKSSRVSDTRWYHAIQMPYSFSSKILNSRDEATSNEVKTVTKKRGMGIDHSVNVYVSPKLFGWLTVKPNLSVDQSLYDRRKVYFIDPDTNVVKDREERGLYHLTTYNTSLSLNTKVYGVFRSRHVENVIIRHVMTPSVSFQYRPDFSKSQYGYYQTVVDDTGKVYRKDHFYGALYGSTPTSESQSMNMSVQNLFQMKVGQGENAKKYDLFTHSVSTAYNWKASQYKLSDLSSSVQASPAKSLSVNLSARHSFYKTDSTGSKIDRMFVEDVDWSDWQSLRRLRLARMTNLTLNLTCRFSGKVKTQGGGDSKKTGEEMNEADFSSDAMQDDLASVNNMSGDRFGDDIMAGSMDIPWNLSTTLSYSENRPSPMSVTKTVWAQTNLDFNLTKHWKISYRSRWDFMEKQFVSQDFVFYRDLHCWEAQFTWTPTGSYKRFYFKINVKSSLLEDLKLEKSSGRSGLY